MTLEEFRHKIEVDKISPYAVGQVIHDMLQYGDHSNDEYRTMFKIVRDKLLYLQSKTELLKKTLDECKTPNDISDFASKTNFASYSDVGIPVSKMLSTRLLQILDEQDKKRSFLHKLFNLFR